MMKQDPSHEDIKQAKAKYTPLTVFRTMATGKSENTQLDSHKTEFGFQFN